MNGYDGQHLTTENNKTSEAGYVVCLPPHASDDEGLLKPQVIPGTFDNHEGCLWLDDCRKIMTESVTEPSM
jgi:hypothetical protein